MLKIIKIILASVLFSSLIIGCGGSSSNNTTQAPTDDPGEEPVDNADDPDRSPFLPPPITLSNQFADVTRDSGIQFQSGYIRPVSNRDIESIVKTGVAAGDYDNDGDVDFFIVRGDIGPNLLYRNEGNLEFVDVAKDAGVDLTKSSEENYRHSGPIFADMDGDGDLDLFIGGVDGDPSQLFENNGDGTFINVTSGSGIHLLSALNNLSATFGDYDLDGDLDLFISHWGTPRDYTNPGDTQHLWRNDTDAEGIKFTSVSLSAGIAPSILTFEDPLARQRTRDWTFTPSFARINDDLYPDLVIASDFNFSQVFINDQDGSFSNATNTNVIIDGNGMGSALGDYDNDGDLDWFVSSIMATADSSNTTPTPLSQIGNRLYRNTHGEFEDFSDFTLVQDGGWGWGSCFIDFNNDGKLDLYQTNGWPLLSEFGGFPTDTSRAFVQGQSAIFEDRAQDLGLHDTLQGRGVVCGDFDQDGDTDILQMHDGATLWRNDASSGDANWLSVSLQGKAPNTQAVGARIYVVTESGSAGTLTENSQMREIMVGNNFMSQNPTDQLFGLGEHDTVATLRIEWPDGEVTERHNLDANQMITIDSPQ